MARIFTLNISFNSKDYLILVSQQSGIKELYYCVRYIDSDLRNILPDDRLLFNQLGELKEPVYLQDDWAVSLLQSTYKAIGNYIKVEK
jgi:hypothetical protein